ncbi:short-chain dehydrogenase reductase family [Apiospora marii]|uniref:short-chain dehydrogenase reductase family n=1 Tax=Apiospora marii TaxID=335849 RepID=UPI00312D2D7E
MTFPYKTVLIIGATSGIGAAMAEKLVTEGCKVIVCGRRQDRIDQFVSKHGSDKAGGIKIDITDHGSIDAFVAEVISTYPSLDCVFLNSGTQSATRLSRPLEFDFAKFHHEVNVNFTGIVNLMIKFLPHLQSKPHPTGLIVTGTHLALVPAATMAAYSASKAALTAFIDCCRAQNRHKSTKIIELYPPVVQTELHDWMGVENGRALGMPVHEFTEIAYNVLSKGEEMVVVGSIATEPREVYMDLVEHRRKIFDKLAGAMLSRFEL